MSLGRENSPVRISSAFLTMVLLLGAAAASAARDTRGPASDPGTILVTGAAFKYLPGDSSLPDGSLTIHRGTRVMLTGADYFGNHTLIAYDLDSNRVPLFSSNDQVGIGQVTEVSGTASLPPRVYHFYCSNHLNMTGALTVIP
ncbi:MAG: hypothetical protein NVSMB57_12970 [Actinomycetota bacterium]